LSDLIPDGVMPGAFLLVEYDTQSQWFAVAATMVARWLEAGHRALYTAMARPRESLVKSLEKLGIDVPYMEQAGQLRIDDWYSVTLKPETSEPEPAQLSNGTHYRYTSVKVADLSVDFSKQLKGQRQSLSKWPDDQTGALNVPESFSMFLRFNEEKPFLEWFEAREIPLQRKMNRISLIPFGRGLHSESLYRRLENICDGVIDVRVMEREDEAKSYLRVQSLKGQPHDSHWREIKIQPNGEAVLTTKAPHTKYFRA